MNVRCHSRLAVPAAMAVTLLLAAVPASAFRMLQNTTVGRVDRGARVTCDAAGGFIHWNTLDIDWRINLANQGWDKATPLRNALESWNDVTGAGHVLSYAWTTNAGFVTDNINTVLWATGNGCTLEENNCLALTVMVLQAGQILIESDITFNNDVNWTTNGAEFDTEAVLAHELGHSLGIHHTEIETGSLPTMSGAYFGIGGRSLHNDDREALRCAYDRYHPCTGAPATPIYIAGPDLSGDIGGPSYDLCQGEAKTFTTPHIPGADSYRWEVVGTPWTWTTNNNELGLSGFYFSPGVITLRVRAQNDCGSSAWRSEDLLILATSDPACGSCSGTFCL